MILTEKDIKQIIIDKPGRTDMERYQAYTRKMLMHIKGVGLDKYIEKINNFEKPELLEVRKKYATNNKAVFARTHRPKDNVFSAPGGSVWYNMTSESQRQAFTKLMNNIVYGYTIKQWLRVFYTPALEYDPMGLVYVEVNQNGKAYPTYKSVLDIWLYKLNGRNVEYVFFEVPKDDKKQNVTRYRVVDDTTDRIVEITGNNVKVISKETFVNPFMRVPGSIISNIYDPVQGFWISADDELVEIADEFLNQGSVKNIFKNYFGFPRAWEYESACPDCKGLGMISGGACTACKGSGKKSRTNPSETLKLPIPQGKDQQVLAPDVAGYITPDIEGWTKMDEELDRLENLMNQTKWGTHQQEKKTNETATGRFIDVQPVNNALHPYSEATEMMEMFITDLVGEHTYGRSYGGSSITYGKRYVQEQPDTLWEKIQNGIEKGATTSSLYDIYMDYLQSRYSANAMEMQKQVRLSKIEPAAFLTFDQMATIQGFPLDELMKKYWYTDWLRLQNDQELTYGDIKVLQKSFDDFCTEKNTAVNQQKVQQATELAKIAATTKKPDPALAN